MDHRLRSPDNMVATWSTQTDTTVDGTSSSRQTVHRRCDLEMYPSDAESSSLAPARVTFQDTPRPSSWTGKYSVPDDDSWSWDEDDEGEKLAGWKRAAEGCDNAAVGTNNSNSRCDPVAMMLDRLYGNEDQSDNNSQTQTRDDRWWDNLRYGYSDMVHEWKRNALRFVPDSCLLNDGDQIIRVDGEDGRGTLLYDLASCR